MSFASVFPIRLVDQALADPEKQTLETVDFLCIDRSEHVPSFLSSVSLKNAIKSGRKKLGKGTYEVQASRKRDEPRERGLLMGWEHAPEMLNSLTRALSVDLFVLSLH
jgi:hypothetical protein